MDPYISRNPIEVVEEHEVVNALSNFQFRVSSFQFRHPILTVGTLFVNRQYTLFRKKCKPRNEGCHRALPKFIYLRPFETLYSSLTHLSIMRDLPCPVFCGACCFPYPSMPRHRSTKKEPDSLLPYFGPHQIFEETLYPVT